MVLMNIIGLAMLIVPGLASICVYHDGKFKVTRDNWQELLFEYVIFGFIILVLNYGIMFISDAKRTVSFAPTVPAYSTLWNAGFVFKYSLTALVIAAVLPIAYKMLSIAKTHIEKIVRDALAEREKENKTDKDIPLK